MADLEILEKIKALALQLHARPEPADFDDKHHDLALDVSVLVTARIEGVSLRCWFGNSVSLYHRKWLQDEIKALQKAEVQS